VLLARPLVGVVARFAARFSVRALEVTVDSTLLWVGAGLAIAAAGTLVATLVAMQTASTGYDMSQVLVFDIPPAAIGFDDEKEMDVYMDIVRRVGELPGVEAVSVGNFVPWRDAGRFGPGFQFTAEGYSAADGEENPRGRLRSVSPGFFGVLGVPLLAGRDFTEEDRGGAERVVIVSQSVAQRLFPNGEAVNRKMWWTDRVLTYNSKNKIVPRRIVGVVADVDDENVVRGPAMTIYHPFRQIGIAGRLFVHATGDPHALVGPVTRLIRATSMNQPVERAATLEDVRAEVLSPDRVRAFVLSGFAGMALLIAVVGVAGVLAFGVSARTREFGVRLAVGSTPRDLLLSVLSEAGRIIAIGVATGASASYVFAAVARGYFPTIRLPGAVPLLTAAAVLVASALIASMIPAARASRVDVLQALRSE